VQFTARFNGVSQEVSVPITAVSGIFAKETGYGFAFAVAADPVASLDAATAPLESSAPGASPPKDKPRRRPKHLQVVK
jgi:stringent starvation protein B